jgi:hypothetical protein
MVHDELAAQPEHRIIVHIFRAFYESWPAWLVKCRTVVYAATSDRG